MSFSKTISVVAALTSIFGASVAGYKLARDSQPEETQKLDAKIEQLEQQLADKTTQLQVPQVAPTSTQVPQVAPTPTQLPPSQPQTTPPPVALPSPPVNLMPSAPPPPPTQR